MKKRNIFEYTSEMEIINSNLLDETFYILKKIYNPNKKCNKNDILNIINKNENTLEDFQTLLCDDADNYLNDIANFAKLKKNQYFGNCISLFTPLYISNFCENSCLYCGYSCLNKIKRAKLTLEQIEMECKKIFETGLREILILTGESRYYSNIEYISESIKIASKYFKTIGIEIYPLNIDEYKILKLSGADFVSVYQETYDTETYDFNHPYGAKRSYSYRFNAQERAIKAGMTGVALGSLLGLFNYKYDSLATAVHSYLLYKKFPHVEISFSVPRIRPFFGNNNHLQSNVNEKQLLKIICAYRILFPYSTITISTREKALFRDNIINIAANKISAGVKVSVGGHDDIPKGDEQFKISDIRSVDEINKKILSLGLQPVYSNHIFL